VSEGEIADALADPLVRVVVAAPALGRGADGDDPQRLAAGVEAAGRWSSSDVPLAPLAVTVAPSSRSAAFATAFARGVSPLAAGRSDPPVGVPSTQVKAPAE
jgi:hypothetical protein